MEVIFQHEVVVIQHFAQFGSEALAVEYVLQANGAARYFVFVGRADAAAGGADFARALGDLARLIEGNVVRQDQRAGFGNFQA